MPLISRIVVPLLPASSDCAGRVRPKSPGLVTRMLLAGDPVSKLSPSPCKHLIVLAQSSAGDSPEMELLPRVSTENKSARCEIDLSPGTLICP